MSEAGQEMTLAQFIDSAKLHPSHRVRREHVELLHQSALAEEADAEVSKWRNEWSKCNAALKRLQAPHDTQCNLVMGGEKCDCYPTDDVAPNLIADLRAKQQTP